MLFRPVEAEEAISVSLVHGCFGRVGEAADSIFGVGYCHTVYQQINFVACYGLVFINTFHLTVHFDTVESLFEVYFQLLFQAAVFTQVDRGQYGVSCPFRV